eukprot:13781687-Alexandrium_andersonii.AAC.1
MLTAAPRSAGPAFPPCPGPGGQQGLARVGGTSAAQGCLQRQQRATLRQRIAQARLRLHSQGTTHCLGGGHLVEAIALLVQGWPCLRIGACPRFCCLPEGVLRLVSERGGEELHGLLAL